MLVWKLPSWFYGLNKNFIDLNITFSFCKTVINSIYKYNNSLISEMNSMCLSELNHQMTILIIAHTKVKPSCLFTIVSTIAQY